MTQTGTLTPEFVEYIPENIQAGVLYISMPLATAVHTCCCGCGHEVVTPLSPTDWKLIFDGVSVSLRPSIGNWSFPCQSHYWVISNHVEWAPAWSLTEIEKNRNYDNWSKTQYYQQEPNDNTPHDTTSMEPIATESWWQTLKRWLGYK